ncbi:MAG: NADH-quinone oxidoreductase subunit NuoE [Desulfobulbaceae bacterium]|nr:NADH-quinone oxidoreductase subunit NuoE [Desulfobulbaceae bacterium]
MLPHEIRQKLTLEIAACEHAREKAIDVMYILQRHYGYLSDEAVHEAAGLLSMTPLELEELATFYDFIYREPVGEYVIHVCDGVVCWMHHEQAVFEYLCRKLGVGLGETTADGLFTLLPTACIGDCHQAPSMLINGKFYGLLTPEKIDVILEQLVCESCNPVLTR